MAIPALAQTPIAMVDCVVGGPCIGTSGKDTITGSEEQDEIYGLEGDDTIDPGNDSVRLRLLWPWLRHRRSDAQFSSA
jgi:RTX calcium-binding nonapeptide repeat (4 copies)